MNNQPPPPQPETIMIEASGANSIRQTDQNDEWEVSIPPTIIEKGDEISVNQSFLEARGTSTEILEFSSSGINQNNRQRIYFEYYANDDGTNDKNKSRDWNNFQFDISPTAPNHPEGLHESGKTYKPNQVFRYDRLLDESKIFANGNGFNREVNGVFYDAIKPTIADPRVANAFSIDFREDYNVAGVFNSFNAIKEVTAVNPTPYVGETFERGLPATGKRIDQQNPNRKDLDLEDMSFSVSDWSINLDALDYFEMAYNQYTNDLDIMIPHTEANTNYLGAIPKGTCIWIDWCPKRRQMSYYGTSQLPNNIAGNIDGDYNGVGGGQDKYQNYNEISNRTKGVRGHFVVNNNNILSTFFDNHGDVGGTDFKGTPAINYGYAGKPCIGMRFSGLGSGGSLQPVLTGVTSMWNSTRTNDGRVDTYDLMNPNTTGGKIDLNTMDGVTNICINLFIRKSPFYVGSFDGSLAPSMNPNVGTYPACSPSTGLPTPRTNSYNLFKDASFDLLFPKNPEQPKVAVPYFLGCAKYINTDSSQPFQVTDPANPKQDLQFAVLSGDEENTSPISLIDYSTWNPSNPYYPHGGSALDYTLTAPLTEDSFMEMNFIPPQEFQEKAIMPDGNLVLLGKGTPQEELVFVQRLDDDSSPSIFLHTDPTQYSNLPDRAKFIITQRNLAQNQNLFIGQPLGSQTSFSAGDPAGWIKQVNTGYTFFTHPIGTRVEWWDFREGMTQRLCINHENYHRALPEGMPILKNTGYWGINEPLLNDDFPSTYTDASFYTALLKENYSTGFSYFLYYNRVGSINGNTTAINSLPDSIYSPNMLTTGIAGQYGMNRGGVPMLLLTEAINQTSHQTTTSFNTPENPTLTQQVRISSTSTHPLANAKQYYALFSPHEYVWNMKLTDYFDGKGMMELNPDKNALTTNDTNGDVQFTHRTHSRNFYVFAPDAFDLINFTDTTLKAVSKQGINSYCGYIPYINQIEVETPKDYMTPDDLSNFWTEQLHKAKDIVCLLDGTTIKGSASRGLIQNECLSAIYGSFGKNNTPDKDGLARDYVTFPMTNGYALGSVIFIDGHEQPNDWSYTGYNKDHPATLADINMPILPRSPESLVHLYGKNEAFQLPDYYTQRQVVWEALPSTTPATIITSASLSPVKKYHYTNYPIAPSGIPNNTATSFNLPDNSQGFDNVLPTSNNFNPDTLTNLNFTSVAPVVAGTADKGNKSVPAYAINPIAGNGAGSGDKYGIWCAADDLDAPFTAQAYPTGGAREDPIYRETSTYPLEYYKDTKRARYLQFSQYVGSDNMTLTYNTEVSAFEYQFLHQPFATTFSLDGGVESGGDNAVRVYDNIPDELDNWEKYSGINVRNWATPILTRGQFNFNEIQNVPNFISQLYPSGINPETDMDATGDAFMSKIGYLDSQYNPRTGTIVKGTIGIGSNPARPQSYAYVPNGTTGADIDVADAIINTSISAEDNPDAEAHGGVGQLMFYPSSVDTTKAELRDSGVRYDYSFTQFGQRGGLKTNNHNKAMGFPNIVGTPQVKDVQTFPRSLNPDGEQRSGYTIEIGSSPLRAVNLPIKLTDGYYFILCPTLIDDPQFYISANNGSVIPAIAIVSKTYVSGDFYTTFQSPITFYAKKRKVVSSIKIQIRNSSMGVPSNLGANSSVIFSIRRFNPQVYRSPLTTAQSQTLAYKQIAQEQADMPKSHQSVLQNFLALGNAVLVPDPQEADYLGQLVARINQQDIPNMSPVERRTFYATEAGQALFREVQDQLMLNEAVEEQEEQPSVLENIILQRQQEAVTARAEEREARFITAQRNAEEQPTGIMSPPDSGVPQSAGGGGVGSRSGSSQSAGSDAGAMYASGTPDRGNSTQSADSDGSFQAPPDSGMPESLPED